MRDKNTIIKGLLNEIHLICEKNNIEYFLIDDLALAVFRDGILPKEGFYSGRIVMTAKNFRKFSNVCKKCLKGDRQLEWLGNNGDFAGLFMRYIDTSTVLYTQQRLICEEHLGMYIEISLLRPIGKIGSCCNTLEKIWQNIKLGNISVKGKWKKRIKAIFLKISSLLGKERFAELFAKTLLNIYRLNASPKAYWCRIGLKEKTQKYPSTFFESHVNYPLEEITVSVSADCDKLIKQIYGEKGYLETGFSEIETGQFFFCDPNISYQLLNLQEYKTQIMKMYIKNIEIYRSRKNSKKQLEPFKKKIELIYYKYFFSFSLRGRIEELERLYESGKREEVMDILNPYVETINEYGPIYIDHRLDKLISKCYI